MESKLTVEEINWIKSLVETQNNIIYRLEEYTKQIKEPQLRMDFQKLCASARNNKAKLLTVLDKKD